MRVNQGNNVAVRGTAISIKSKKKKKQKKRKKKRRKGKHVNMYFEIADK